MSILVPMGVFLQELLGHTEAHLIKTAAVKLPISILVLEKKKSCLYIMWLSGTEKRIKLLVFNLS